MTTTGFLLPNGCLVDSEVVRDVELKQLTGHEEDMLRDKKTLREGNVIAKLLKKVTTRIGQETDPARIASIYDGYFLIADLTYLLVMLRAISIDTRYSFEATCPSCSYSGSYGIDLLSLPIDEQDDRNRGRTEYNVPVMDGGDKHIVTFGPLLVRHMPLLEGMQTEGKNERGTNELAIQLKKLDGSPIDKKAMKDLSWGFRQRIRQEMDKVSGGIDTSLAMECHRCDKTFKDTMPVEMKGFFFPAMEKSEPPMAVPSRLYGKTSPSSEPDGTGALTR
jgi:hypothetical protein